MWLFSYRSFGKDASHASTMTARQKRWMRQEQATRIDPIRRGIPAHIRLRLAHVLTHREEIGRTPRSTSLTRGVREKPRGWWGTFSSGTWRTLPSASIAWVVVFCVVCCATSIMRLPKTRDPHEELMSTIAKRMRCLNYHQLRSKPPDSATLAACVRTRHPCRVHT